MKTLLVIAPNNALAGAIRAALDPQSYRVIEQAAFRGDELRLMAPSIDACVIDVDMPSVEAIRTIERFRRDLPRCPMFLYASNANRTWEEDAYLLGVTHILTKPVRGRLLHSLLDRLSPGKPADEPHPVDPPRPATVPDRRAADPGTVPGRMLELLRNCSSILCHSLSAEPVLKEFLLLLREILGVNRAVIVLRRSPAFLAARPRPARTG